jgi:TolB-like protein
MSIRFVSVTGFILSLFLLSSCAYQFGAGNRSIPGGYKSISVPVFKNRSYETGVEVSFTNALLQEFQRGGVAKVTADSLSEARVEGEIQDVRYYSEGKIKFGDEAAPYLPEGTVLTTEYTISITTKLRVVRQSDGIEIWAASFTRERQYSAPKVTVAGLNSVNPLYNQSARRQYIDGLAADIMAEAYNRMTESF